MRPRVVYVHGNGNKVRSELLKSQWDTALFGRDMAEASRMAYWAPVRYPEPLPDLRPDPLDGGSELIEETPAAVDRAATEPPEDFVARTLGEARLEAGEFALEGRAGADESALVDWLRKMTYLADTLAQAGEPEEPGAKLPLETLPLPRTGRTAVFRLLVKHAFKDVHGYFFGGSGPAMREVVEETLAGVDGGPLVVVGHSLGTILAYEVLMEQGREVELLVTVGSPLAITEVQDHLARPPAVPAGVAAWHNASDLRDLVALDHTLRPEFAPQERVTDLLVTNDSGNHHGISEYLSQHEVRAPVQRIFDGTG
ncbi:hypothetical protein NCG97_34345 [Streptomyces lydicamycinicus]|uniref:Putative peptidase n=1 Tax=Streptomyces lydicamycinicus TaxID=1546107 RepID=A0A0N7YL51_9ACTN|nr:hypothetical protein [Streptomyces lydicamycinicus]USA04552.1 hypothetical protein NCG97_34345 [Streptomyces lydicamycinicus]GAO07835.1 putative peptidase [Streptomyces lydicamycinicus]